MAPNWPTPDNSADLPKDGWAWSDFSRLVFEFAGVLRAADLMPDDEDEYWEKPWHWGREHQLWVDAGEPRSTYGSEPASLEWERFVRATTETEAE